MFTQKAFFIVILIGITSLFLLSCAGTRGDQEPDYMAGSSQQDDLDDIEALLGITSTRDTEETKAQPPPKRRQTEQLNLLEGTESLSKEATQSTAVAEQQKYETRIAKLEEELKSKNREINVLKSELSSKESQIDNLSRQSQMSAPVRGTSTIVSSIAPEEYEARYQQARNAFESRNYETAIQYFESLLAASTTHSLASNAQYWIGECYYALKQYDAAIIAFEKVLTFPRTNKNIDSQFKIGLCYARKGNKTKAAEEFERLNNNYPGHRFQSRVNDILSRL
jgi:tol-pal system protein YbgF